jgi:hypothetical protein
MSESAVDICSSGSDYIRFVGPERNWPSESHIRIAIENEMWEYHDITKAELVCYRDVAKRDERSVSREERATIKNVSEVLEQWFQDAADGVDDVGDHMAEDDRSYFEALAMEASFVTMAFQDDGNFESISPE